LAAKDQRVVEIDRAFLPSASITPPVFVDENAV